MRPGHSRRFSPTLPSESARLKPVPERLTMSQCRLYTCISEKRILMFLYVSHIYYIYIYIHSPMNRM